MNIYAIRNESASGKAPEHDSVGGCHSGGAVVVANSKQEAVQKLKDHYDSLSYDNGTADPELLHLVRGPGVIIYCDGEC